MDRLNDRPDSADRCWDALIAYATAPTPAQLEVVRELYHAVPEHRRIYLLGDMDQNDVRVRVLLAEPGETIPARRPDRTLTVTSRTREWALDYFRRSERGIAESRERDTVDGPETAIDIPLRVGGTVYPQGWTEPPGPEVLQIDYPAPVVHSDRKYPTVMHAYWALSTDDASWHDRIAAAGRDLDARTLDEQAPRRDDWPTVRLGVMAALLRDKVRPASGDGAPAARPATPGCSPATGARGTGVRAAPTGWGDCWSSCAPSSRGDNRHHRPGGFRAGDAQCSVSGPATP
ncbi:DUF7639 domain-containing protein [Micromonosporaceae bacterium Da 78-11]